MSAVIENALIEQLHALDEQHQSEALEFVQFLVSKSKAVTPNQPRAFDPMRYSGAVR